MVIFVFPEDAALMNSEQAISKTSELIQIRIVYLYEDADWYSIRLDLFGKSIQAFAEAFEASGDFVRGLPCGAHDHGLGRRINIRGRQRDADNQGRRAVCFRL